ncbi:MAG: hypothetical protein ACO259_09980, partial [Bacteroidia bacterium]
MEVLKPFRLKVVQSILEGYDYQKAFHLHFAHLCQQNRNWGSKDRKIYKAICYAYFRLGHLSSKCTLEEGILMAVKGLNDGFADIDQKSIFPYTELCTDKLSALRWYDCLLQQKPVYLSVHPKHLASVKQFIHNNGMTCVYEQGNCIGLAPNTACDELIQRGWAWVMDKASQTIASQVDIQTNDTVWDACSGAGGKALYLTAFKPGPFHLTCSDKRLSILDNLKERFKTLQFQQPKVELADLTKGFQLPNAYDVIVLDVPCTGSGTWGRTPEHIAHFDLQSIQSYQVLQQNIFAEVIKHLKPNGRLYYMTCSVFKAENEDNINYWAKHYDLQIKSTNYAFDEKGLSDV